MRDAHCDRGWRLYQDNVRAAYLKRDCPGGEYVTHGKIEVCGCGKKSRFVPADTKLRIVEIEMKNGKPKEVAC